MTSPAPEAFDSKDEVAAWSSATDKIREVAKWIAASFGALSALLIGTAPLTGVAEIGWSTSLLLPILGGALALGGIGYIVWRTTSILAPSQVTLQDVAENKNFTAYRAQIAADPSAYLGATRGIDLGTFLTIRDQDYKDIAAIDLVIRQDDRLTAEEVKALWDARSKVSRRISASGQVSSRLLAIASFIDVSTDFRLARRWLFLAAVLSVIGILTFVISAGSTSTGAEASQIPARVSLTDAGRESILPLLGNDCPAVFSAVVLSGGPDGPWELLVTENGCISGTVVATSDEADVLFIFDRTEN